MIEIRQYLDDRANVHDRVWTFAMKERMFRDKGHTGNLVAWVYAANLDQAIFVGEALKAMEDWQMRLLAKKAKPKKYEEAVIESKPESLGDACFSPTGEKIDEVFVYNAPSRCNELFPTFLMPRMVAGGPLTNDTFKCALKPVSTSDYRVAFTDAELARLRSIFPSGVCDWSTPAVEQQPFQGTWQSFGP